MRKLSLTIFILLLYTILIGYTLTARLYGAEYQPFFTPLISLLAFTFALLHGRENLGWKRMLLLVGLTFGVSLLFECLGVVTGKVYGPYHYTDMLGYKFLGLVPILIPVAWTMMSYPSFIIAARLAPPQRSLWTWRLLVAALGALAMTAWDVAMDPLMVAGGHWVWEIKGDFFGVPLQNYFGWWLTVFTTFILFLWLGKITPEHLFRTESNYTRLAVVSYSVIGLSSILSCLQVGMGGPALAGFFAMLPWALLGWLNFASVPQ